MAGERAHLRGLPFRRLTRAWQLRIDEELESLGKNRVWLARELGVTPGSVTYMLRDGTSSSRLVESVCEVLKVPPPEFEGEHEEMLVHALRFLTERDPKFAQRLLGQAQKRVEELSKKERKSD